MLLCRSWAKLGTGFFVRDPSIRDMIAPGGEVAESVQVERNVTKMRWAIRGGRVVRKILAVFLFLFLLCGIAAAAEFDVKEVCELVSQESDDPIIGIWYMHPVADMKNMYSHIAIIKNEKESRPGWEYLGISLDSKLLGLADGDVLIIFKKTSIPHVYEAQTRMLQKGPAFLNGDVLDMIRVQKKAESGFASTLQPIYTYFERVKDYRVSE